MEKKSFGLVGIVVIDRKIFLRIAYNSFIDTQKTHNTPIKLYVMKNVKRIIGGIMIAILISGLVAAEAHKYGLQSALIAFGLSLAFIAFILIAAWLIASDE